MQIGNGHQWYCASTPKDKVSHLASRLSERLTLLLGAREVRVSHHPKTEPKWDLEEVYALCAQNKFCHSLRNVNISSKTHVYTLEAFWSYQSVVRNLEKDESNNNNASQYSLFCVGA